MPLIGTRGAASSRGFGRFGGAPGLAGFAWLENQNSGSAGFGTLPSVTSSIPEFSTAFSYNSEGTFTFTAPSSAIYKFELRAPIGTGGGLYAGKVVATATLTQGQTLLCRMGNKRAADSDADGGIFLFASDNTLYMAAGGPGGYGGSDGSNYTQYYRSNMNASTTTSGNDGYAYPSGSTVFNGKGGINGGGGGAGSASDNSTSGGNGGNASDGQNTQGTSGNCGGGGGGWFGNGGNSSGSGNYGGGIKGQSRGNSTFGGGGSGESGGGGGGGFSGGGAGAWNTSWAGAVGGGGSNFIGNGFNTVENTTYGTSPVGSYFYVSTGI